MKTVLVSAYAINPYKGSEDGTGWNWLVQIAKTQKVIAITRENNQSEIERYLEENNIPEADNIQFKYYDTPYWMRWWKRKEKGALIYYYMWQLFLPFFILLNKLKFDIVHQLNFHNDWAPSLLWIFKKPFVWGPIGHHPVVPDEYLKASYGWKVRLKNQLNAFAKWSFWNLDPLLWLTKKNADHILIINSSVIEKLRLKDNFTIIPAIAAKEANKTKGIKHEGFNVLSVGRFVSLKGMDMSIKSFHRFYSSLDDGQKNNVRLKLVGKGPDKNMLKQLADTLGISDVVDFIEWMPQAEFLKLYQQSNVFLFPSHEGAGMVVPEALSYGVPVICYDNYGPGELVNDDCAIKIPYSNYNRSLNQFSDALKHLYLNENIQLKMQLAATEHYENKFRWSLKSEVIESVYKKVTKNETAKDNLHPSAERLQWESTGSVSGN